MSFFKNPYPPVFFRFFLYPGILWFLKKRRFLFYKNNTKPHSELFLLNHATSPFSELHNNNLLYLLWHSNSGEKCTQPLFLRSVVGQLTPEW